MIKRPVMVLWETLESEPTKLVNLNKLLTLNGQSIKLFGQYIKKEG